MKKFIEKKKIIIISIVIALIVSTFIVAPEKTFAIDAYERAVGIDVSSHNGTLDWETVKNSGIDFAIIRIGFGDNVPAYHDVQATRNIQECERLKIPYGVYIYSYAISIPEIESEIDHVITMINGYNPPLGIWFDMEDADGYKYKNAFPPEQHGKELTDFCLHFMRGIKAKGYSNVGVYANKNYFTSILDYNAIRAEGMIWLAHWGISEPSMECEIWQYSSDGEVPGSSARTDMNYIYPDSQLMAKIKSSPEEDNPEVETEDSKGDVNGDGIISALDYIAIKKHIMKTKLITDETVAKAADVNNDGVISALDYVAVRKIIIKQAKEG